MKKFIKNNIKVLISFILGSVIFGTIVYAATYKLSGSNVSYNNNSSKLTATNAKAAIDELNEKANTFFDIDFGTLKVNSVAPIFASSKGICIKVYNKVRCLSTNFEVEWNRMPQKFSDIYCERGYDVEYDSGYSQCWDDFFWCVIDDYSLSCTMDIKTEENNNASCHVKLMDGSVSCN